MSKLTLKTCPRKRMLSPLLGLATLLAFVVAVGLAGCGEAEEAADADSTVGATMSTEAATATGNDGTQDAAGSEATTDQEQSSDDQGQRSGSQLSAEDEDDATDIAGAYLAAKTDFTSSQFEWEVLNVVEDDEGEPWAKVKATPKDDEGVETYYFYVLLPTGWEMWNVYGMGTDAEPVDEKNMPEEIQGKL